MARPALSRRSTKGSSRPLEGCLRSRGRRGRALVWGSERLAAEEDPLALLCSPPRRGQTRLRRKGRRGPRRRALSLAAHFPPPQAPRDRRLTIVVASATGRRRLRPSHAALRRRSAPPLSNISHMRRRWVRHQTVRGRPLGPHRPQRREVWALALVASARRRTALSHAPSTAAVAAAAAGARPPPPRRRFLLQPPTSGAPASSVSPRPRRR